MYAVQVSVGRVLCYRAMVLITKETRTTTAGARCLAAGQSVGSAYLVYLLCKGRARARERLMYSTERSSCDRTCTCV